MTEKQLKKYLLAMRNLIKNPKNWCQNIGATDKYGSSVATLDPDAHSFCLIGASFKVTQGNSYEINRHIEKFLPKNQYSLIDYNDSRSHRSVIRLLDKAIANV